jgi:hypothetical protein
MISLIKILKEIYINEGGNVFKNTEYDTEDVLLNNIAPTIKKFTEDLGKLFPGKRSTFAALNDKSNWLGSTGNKPQSGDVDLAYSEEAFFKDGKIDLEGWGISETEYTPLYEKNKKAARTATDEQIQLKSIIQLIVNKINNSGGEMYASDKASGAGSIHLSYPQHDPSGKKLDIRAQLDLDVGDMDWLKFRFNSELPKDDSNIKGLHRGQLMLAMFATLGYTFKSGRGFVRKETGETIANKPKEAMEVFNQEYKPKQPLTLDIINNYSKLIDYINNNLKPDDKEKTLNMFKEALRRAGAYVPENI